MVGRMYSNSSSAFSVFDFIKLFIILLNNYFLQNYVLLDTRSLLPLKEPQCTASVVRSTTTTITCIHFFTCLIFTLLIVVK